MTSTTARHYKINKAARFRIVDGEAVIVNQSTNKIIILNELGSLLFPRIVEGESIETMLDDLRNSFNLPTANAERDLTAFLDELTDQALIVADETGR